MGVLTMKRNATIAIGEDITLKELGTDSKDYYDAYAFTLKLSSSRLAYSCLDFLKKNPLHVDTDMRTAG